MAEIFENTQKYKCIVRSASFIAIYIVINNEFQLSIMNFESTLKGSRRPKKVKLDL